MPSSEALYRSLLELAADGILTIDRQGIVVSFNRAAERIFGYVEAEIVGRNVKELMPEPYRGQHDQYIRRYQATGEARVIGIGREVVGRRKDGSTFPMDLSVSEVVVPGAHRYLGIIRDLTERRRFETLADVGRIASGLAHEIGTPMNIILGYAERLRNRVTALDGLQELDAAAPIAVTAGVARRIGDGLGVIIEQVERVSRLMASLLSYARRPPMERRPTVLEPIVRSVMSVLGDRLRDRKVTPHLELDSGAPTLEADADRLEQVLLNLAANAIDAMPDGGRLTIALRGLSDPARLELVVTDTGTGIPADQLAAIFEPFVTTKAPGKGTGLGLAVVRSIVREHGGSIRVSSEVGQGTAFVIELPAQDH